MTASTTAPRQTPKPPSSRLGESGQARAMKLRVYLSSGQAKRLDQWLFGAQRFRNEAVSFCTTRRRARAQWLHHHPVLAKEWRPEEFQGSDANACSKWLTSRLQGAREEAAAHLHLLSCPKPEMVQRVTDSFAHWSRGEQAEVKDGWLLTVPRTVLDQVLQDMAKTEARALADRRSAKTQWNTSEVRRVSGFPRFQKWRYPGSVRLQVSASKNAAFRDHWQAGKLFVPGLGHVRFRDSGYVLPTTPPALLTLTRDAAGHVYACFLCVEHEYRQIKPSVEDAKAKPLPIDPATGFPVARAIDLSLTHLGVDDQGTPLGRKRHLKRFARALRRKNQYLARKQKGSARWRKAKRELGKLHVRMANCREAELRHQAKTLVDRSAIVCLEDYRLAFMLQNAKLAASTHDAGLYRFKQLIQAQCDQQGKLLLHCGRLDASTQICSVCQHKNTDLKNNLNCRTWTCPGCQATHDRDHNAAINILLMALERAITQDPSTGPENGLGRLTSSRVLHPELSAFIARGGLTAIWEHHRSQVRRKAGLPCLGPQEADETRVSPNNPRSAVRNSRARVR